MGVNSNQYLQGINQTTGTGAPVHSAVAGDRYTDTATGITYQYTTSWQTVSYSAGGLTYFTEAQATASPNATVNVDSLTAVASTTNADFVIAPKGDGAILAQVPNGGSNGNKRGLLAVDFQTYPTSGDPTRVASGLNSVILNGFWNTASGSSSTVLNGSRSLAIGDNSLVLNGLSNTTNGAYAITGGQYSVTTDLHDLAIGNTCNSSGGYSIAMGSNCTAVTRAVAIGWFNTSARYGFSANSNNNASGWSSIALGDSSNSFSTQTKLVIGCTGSTVGGAQIGLMGLTNRTTGNTPTEIAVASTTSTAIYQLALQDNQAMRVKGSIIGKQSGSTNIGAWDFDYVIVRGVGVGTTSVVVSNVNVVTNIPAWGTPTITADTARGYASIKVIGASATNIQWTGRVDSTETLYA
jgi:hypothetical protein